MREGGREREREKEEGETEEEKVIEKDYFGLGKFKVKLRKILPLCVHEKRHLGICLSSTFSGVWLRLSVSVG